MIVPKYKIGDKLIGKDKKVPWEHKFKHIRYHWKVEGIKFDMGYCGVYILWNRDKRFTRLNNIDEVDKDFELDISAMRKDKLNRINKSIEASF